MMGLAAHKVDSLSLSGGGHPAEYTPENTYLEITYV